MSTRQWLLCLNMMHAWGLWCQWWEPEIGDNFNWFVRQHKFKHKQTATADTGLCTMSTIILFHLFDSMQACWTIWHTDINWKLMMRNCQSTESIAIARTNLNRVLFPLQMAATRYFHNDNCFSNFQNKNDFKLVIGFFSSEKYVLNHRL